VSGIGHAVLYAAFAVVALWLLGELLLQHRAEPHWRGLALLGFLGLVVGVAQGSLPLIGLGVVAFGAGQYLVSRSVRTGGRTHWSLRAADGALPGPLAGLPLLGTVFPAGEAQNGVVPPPEPLVGEVGPVEPLEPLEPVQAAPEGYGYEPTTAYDYDYPAAEYVQSEYEQQQPQQEPVYAQYDYGQQQQQPQYDYNGYEQQPAYPQYDYGQQSQQGQPQQEQVPYYGYEQPQPGYYDPQYQQQQQPYGYQPEPVGTPPEPESWQQQYPPQQYG
jgi:hypothetical protein